MKNQWEETGDKCFDLASELVTDIISMPDEEFLQLLKTKNVDLSAETYEFKRNIQSTFEKLGLALPTKLQNLPTSYNISPQFLEKEMRQQLGLNSESLLANDFNDDLPAKLDESQKPLDTKNPRQI